MEKFKMTSWPEPCYCGSDDCIKCHPVFAFDDDGPAGFDDYRNEYLERRDDEGGQ